MKKIFYNIFVLLSFVMLMTACGTDDMEFKNADVTEVKKLYEPATEKAISLTSSGSLYFSWEPAIAKDGGSPLYEVYFDKDGGDFSSPLFVLSSDLWIFQRSEYLSQDIKQSSSTSRSRTG